LIALKTFDENSGYACSLRIENYCGKDQLKEEFIFIKEFVNHEFKLSQNLLASPNFTKISL
jgi:hypothetical protein